MRRAASAALALGFVSCFDPTHDDEIAALGPEVDGVEEGPLHRPGQACNVCHGEAGPGPELVVAGTIYRYLEDFAEKKYVPMPNVVVRFTDADATTFSVTTNQVGNFFVEPNDLPRPPTFPLFVALDYTVPGTETHFVKPMKTRIGRDAGCGGCHRYPSSPDATHTDPVFVKELRKDGLL